MRGGKTGRGSALAWAALAASLAASCASLPGYELAGNARYRGQALAGAAVTAAPLSGAARQAVSSTAGRFTLLLPAGTWSLGGKGRGPAGEPLVAVWGGNPLDLYGPPGEEVNLAFLPDPGPPAARPETGIGGRVLLDGEPAAGVSVAAYLAGTPIKGPPYLSALPTGEDGAFDLPLGPGTYEIVARKRGGSGAMPEPPGSAGGQNTGSAGAEGPLHKGDLFGAYPYNPVTLREGQGLALEIPVTAVKKPREGGTLSSGQAILVTGVLRDEQGRPVPGARALLYPTPALAGRPAAISGPADAGGRFRIEAAKEGRFYLAARQRIGAPPESGELMGTYGGSDDHALELRWGGRYEGIEMTMEPMP